MTGSLKSFAPNEPSAEALSEAGQKYYDWLLATSGVSSRVGEKSKATPSDWMDLIGSAGMIMGAIKQKDGNQRKLVITMQNSSPHVVVPFAVKLPADKFYAKSGLSLMTPGDSSEAEFDINTGFYYSNYDPCEFYIHFMVVASNGKYTKCYLHFDAMSGNYFIPKVFYAYGKTVHFPKSDKESNKQFPENVVAAAEGNDDHPSFGLSMVKVVIDPEDGTSKIGVVITPWKIGTVAPASGYFTFPSSGYYKATLYGTPSDGARDVGLMAWNYLKRSNGDPITSAAGTEAGLRSLVGGLASFVTMGVNLLMGARNLNRKDNGCHNLVLTIKNMTSYTVTMSHVERAEGCHVENSFMPPHGEGTVTLGTKNFAGGTPSNDNGPGVVLTLNNGKVGTKFQVGYADTTRSGFSGQIRVRHIIQNGYWCKDLDGYDLSCQYQNSSFYKSMADGKPEFLIMAPPVSKGEADLTLVLIN